MLKLNKCPKNYTADLDKATSPGDTVEQVKKSLSSRGRDILQDLERIDTGRLNIPVYISRVGSYAQSVMPTGKQMGKGSSPDQARASAIMELVERYSLFSFQNKQENFISLTWTEAEAKFPNDLIPINEIIYSVGEDISPEDAQTVMDLIKWDFCPALHLQGNREYHLPLNWFKKLNEFNGSSAGNTFEESILQGGCELIERHVCAIIDREEPLLPTIDPDSFQDPTLIELYQTFCKNNIEIWLKDFTLNMGIPTVGALAFDKSTFPHLSEIVFTAGTATSPEKAAVRALTETAQLAGDFETGSSYDPSGLRKFNLIEDTNWLRQGETVSINNLPDISDNDLFHELKGLTAELDFRGYQFYTVNTTNPELQVPANYNIIPGFLFRERTPFASLGLFVGRILAEEYPVEKASGKLDILEQIYPGKYFIPFFRGLIELRKGNPEQADKQFRQSEPMQPSREEQSLVAFYQAYANTQTESWEKALDNLDRAISLSSDNHAYYNLRGVAHFKLQEFYKAASDFESALNIDMGSATDLANLGLCHKFMDNPEKARELLNKSLELDPSLDFIKRHLKELEEFQ